MKLKKSAGRLGGKLEVDLCILDLAELSHATGTGSGILLVEAWW